MNKREVVEGSARSTSHSALQAWSDPFQGGGWYPSDGSLIVGVSRATGSARKLEEKAEQIVDSYLRAGEQGDWRALDALVNRVYGRPTERIEQVTGESEIMSALKQLSKKDLQAMVQQGRQELEVKAIMRVMTAEERDEFLGRMAPEERREVLRERDLDEQRERERREEMRLRGFDPDDPRPKETGTPEDFAWKDRRKARLRAVEQKAV